MRGYLLPTGLLVSSLLACSAPQSSPSPQQGTPASTAERARTLILAMPSLPTNLDPGVATSGAENMLHRALYEGLVNFKGSSTVEVEPVLAESFEPNADQSVWTFKLRRGVKFSDGSDFNAEAAKAGLVRMVKIGLLGNTINRFTSEDPENNLVVKDEYPGMALRVLLSDPAAGAGHSLWHVYRLARGDESAREDRGRPERLRPSVVHQQRCRHRSLPA